MSANLLPASWYEAETDVFMSTGEKVAIRKVTRLFQLQVTICIITVSLSLLSSSPNVRHLCIPSVYMSLFSLSVQYLTYILTLTLPRLTYFQPECWRLSVTLHSWRVSSSRTERADPKPQEEKLDSTSCLWSYHHFFLFLLLSKSFCLSYNITLDSISLKL